jgi:PTS system mannose-specific IID component
MNGRLHGGDLMRMAIRASALQATWNYERQQGLGWAFAMEPALERLYADPAERRERVAEHTAYFNTQPTLASVALGAIARLEERRAQGEPLDAGTIGRIKGVLGSSLAAFGDRLFWFSLRPFSACLGVLLVAAGLPPALGALALWLCYNGLHQTLRVVGLRWGYDRGPEVLDAPLRARLQSWIRFLGVAGAGLTGALVAVVLAPEGTPRPVGQQLLFVMGLAVGLMGARLARPSPTEWALAAGLVSVAVAWTRG